MKIKNFLKILSFFIIIAIYSITSTYAYLEQYESYKWLRSEIIKNAYDEYNDFKTNQLYKNSSEYKELENLVKIENIFDISAKEIEKNIELKKINLLNKIKDKEIINTGQKEIDKEIDKLQYNGRYVVLELPWQLITIDDWDYVYIYNHKITGNIDVYGEIQSVFNKYKTDKDIVKNTRWFKKDLLSLLKKYNIEHKEISWYYIDANIIIWKNNSIKNTRNEKFFISTWFTTPFLEENYEVNNKNKKYLWKYLTDDDITYSYNVRDENRSSSDIYVNINTFKDTIYLWSVANKDKIIEWKILWWQLDIFVYKIEKNIFEYVILFFSLVLWILLWLYLSHNFVANYRNNFNKIPEEI